MKEYDLTDQVHVAWEHFDKMLEEKINHIHELTGIEKERLIKLNPMDGASKLEKKCEEAIRHWGCNMIFSYSNATVNEGNVYKQLGFTQSKITQGQAWVVERDFSLMRLVTCCANGKGARNEDLFCRGAVKVHITANRLWVKNISI